MPLRRIHVVPTSHWDREWYLPFESLRVRLVTMLDRVLDLLDHHPDYTFTLDGQSVLLDDYLEVRPEQADRVQELVSEGRLFAGPWYVQPDEFLVWGESLVRNLRLGMRRAEKRGGAMRVGYVPDSFGHIAALPDILSAAGISSAVFARGMGDEAEQTGDVFWWTGPGGKRVLAHRLPLGYGPVAGVPTETVSARDILMTLARRLGERTCAPIGLLLAGSDHSPPDLRLPALMDDLRQSDGPRWAFSDLGRFMGELRESVDSRPDFTGELRSGRFHPLLAGVLSSRLYLKVRNFELQRMLLRYAEPAATLASTFGLPYPHHLLTLAWQLLLQNHPHDSLCGCSVDDVHREMETRFDKAAQIAEAVQREALRGIAAELTPRSDGHPLLAINPEGFPETGHIETSLHLTRDEMCQPTTIRDGDCDLAVQTLWERTTVVASATLAPHPEVIGPWLEQTADRYPPRAFRLRRRKGRLLVELDVGFASSDTPSLPDRVLPALLENPPDGVEIRATKRERRIAVHLRSALPPLGYRTLTYSAGETGVQHNEILVGDRHLENELVRVAVQQDGTLSIRHKALDWTVDGLHRLRSVADRGDTYTHSALPQDHGVEATLDSVRVVECGPVRGTLELAYRMAIPTSLSANRARRARRTVVHRIVTRLSLWTGCPRVEVHTSFENCARDHRLRAHFPLPFHPVSVAADGAYCVLKRATSVEGRPDWVESTSDGHPLSLFVDANDGARGAALLAAGATEYGCDDGLSLTLVRAVGWLARDGLPERPELAGPPLPVEEAQCLRTVEMRYALLLHTGDWREGGVLREARRFALPPLLTPVASGNGASSQECSLGRMNEGYVVTSLERSEDGRVTCRAYNASGGPLPAPPGLQVDLGGSPCEEQRHEIPPWGLVTVEMSGPV